MHGDYFLRIAWTGETPSAAEAGFTEEGSVTLDQGEVARLNAQTDLLTRPVDDLRTLSLADANRLFLLAKTKLHGLVERTAQSLKLRMDERNIHLHLTLDEMALNLDPQRIEQVLINLLSSALKDTPNGGTVTVGSKKDDHYACLAVRDTGAGFDVAAEQLFRRFYTSGESEDGGTGLGLSLVEALVGLHSGKVSASNHPEGGTVFEVRLPLQLC